MNRLPDVSAVTESTSVLSENYQKTRRLVGYIPRHRADGDTYAGLGFKSGLEIHQQLLTEKKLFCHCPAGIYQRGEFDAEVIRHMRPTLSEMGEYDGTALMEKKTRKTIVYRIKDETACTYDFDDTPPFKINREALDFALEIALMLQTNIVGELHITRKQYLDGSIPTGFQRTAIVGIEGEIPLANKKVRVIQLSIEEDSCREVSDIGHTRVYTTDRLGIPLIETVTYPDMLTPDEVAEAAQYLRLLVRTSGKVRTGLGAARQDVNVSIEGGTRVEIKGVSRIRWIPELTHNEAFRQKALLLIRQELIQRISNPAAWGISSQEIDRDRLSGLPDLVADNLQPDDHLLAVNLPGFKDILSFFTQPGHCFADELAGRLKVIACLEKPNLVHSEGSTWFDVGDAAAIRTMSGGGENDTQLLFWGPAADMATALETIEERCRLAFEGVPNETRKALVDGTTIFERVLPGPDRMYPDTDSAPIPVASEHIEKIRAEVITALPGWLVKLRRWKVPPDSHHYLITRRMVPLVEDIVAQTGWPEKYVALLFGHTLKSIERKEGRSDRFKPEMVATVCYHLSKAGLDRRWAREVLAVFYANPARSIKAVTEQIVSGELTLEAAVSRIPDLVAQFEKANSSSNQNARVRWLVGQLKKQVLGSVDVSELAARVAKELGDV